MADQSGNVKDHLEAVPGEPKQSEDQPGGQTPGRPDHAEPGSPPRPEKPDEAEPPGKPGHDKESGPATGAGEQGDTEEVLSPRELAASIQERSQMRRSGLDSLEGTAFFGGRTSFGGPASMSGPAAGRDVNIFVGRSARATLPAGAVGRERLRQVREVHVAGASYSKAVTILAEEHLLILVGTDGSGRRTTALHLLTQLADDQVNVIDAQIAQAIGDETIFSEGACYLAEIPTRADTWELTHAHMAALASKLQERNAHLIVIASRELAIDTEGVARFVAEHRKPDCWEVLRKHVRRDGNRAPMAERLLGAAAIRTACESMASPGSAAEVAAKILEVAGADGQVEDVLSFINAVRRQQVRQILRRDAGENRRTRVEALCRTALLVSLAVFTDMSYVDATMAAEALATRFIATELEGHGREIFLTRREHLLSQMDFVLTEGQITRRWGTAHTQRVTFRDPALRIAVLDELWQEYDRSLRSLLEWLSDLAVNAPAPEVRVRSAQVVGTLAVREFAYFCDRVLLGWATADDLKAREATAAALETVAVAGKMRAQVNQLLAEWCRDGNLRLQQTAVLAMGTRVSESHLRDTLTNLRQLALRSNGRNSEPMRRAVRQAISELYSGPDKREVVLTLATWAVATDPVTRRLARQCMAPLIHFVDPAGRPSLLSACVDAPDLIDPVGTAVASLLEQPATDAEAPTRRDTWETLEGWVEAAEHHQELLEPVTKVLAALQARNAGIEGQLRFYLSLWAFRNSRLNHTHYSEESL